MIISINQPAYLPWLGYFSRIHAADIHIVLDHVQYEKNSMTNRNKILQHTQPVLLTVPIKKNHGQRIVDAQIQSNLNWQKKHLKSIEAAYKKAPYYQEYQPFLSQMLTTPHSNLMSLLKPQLEFFIKALGISTPIYYSSDFSWQYQKSDLVLEICSHFSATTYISGLFGRDYLDENSFKNKGINIEYQDYVHPQYSQFKAPFVSHLSTLDLLMHHGKNSLNILQEKT